MPNSAQKPIDNVQVGTAQIHLMNVMLREDIRLDEVHIESGDVRLDALSSDKSLRASAGETRVRIVMSEPNLNRIITTNTPQDVPIKNLKIELFSGKARVSGQYVKLFAIPFTVEIVPRIVNGVRIVLDWKQANVGFGLPAAIVEMIQQRVNDDMNLDLSKLPIPVWIDELRCEPGRMTALGKVKLNWPPLATLQAIPPTTDQADNILPSEFSDPPITSEKSPISDNNVPQQLPGDGGSIV